MSRTFTGKITTGQLAAMVAIAFHNSEAFEGDVLPKDCTDAEDYLKKNHFYNIKNLTPQIEKDLSKVEFDEENVYWEDGDGSSGTDHITGFHTMSNGLAYLGVTAGGDWEWPLFYIIYYDGMKLRAYIPTDGNHWNTDLNSAYGNNYDDVNFPDDLNATKRFGVKVDDLGDMDISALVNDIQSRIVFKDGGKFVEPKKFSDLKLTKEESYIMNRTPAQKKADEDKKKADDTAEMAAWQARMQDRTRWIFV